MRGTRLRLSAAGPADRGGIMYDMRSAPPSRWHSAAGVLLTLAVVAAGCGGDPGVGSDESATTTVVADPVSELRRTRTTTPTTAAPSPLPPLPIPDPIPLDAHAPTPDVVIGHITIPRLGVDEPLHQGMTLTAINRGPSQWPGTALPGGVGNMVIAGHRTTHSRPFYDLDLVQPGDQMVVETDQGRFTYAAVSTEIVGEEALWIATQSYGFTATTFACHPKGSARQRIVVHWQMVDDTGAPVPALA